MKITMEYEGKVKDLQIKEGKYFILTIKNVRMLPYDFIFNDEYTIPLSGEYCYRIYEPNTPIKFSLTNDGNFEILD
ncbi:MAG: hypothetical protein AB7V16_12805 [Vulcanibacillus sp.]